MPITEKQLARRRSYIGASEVPAILGCDPFRSGYEVWLDKTGQLEHGRDETNEAAMLGNMLEGSILSWFAAKYKVQLKRNQWRVHNNGYMSASHDALIDTRQPGWETPQGVEAKTTNILGRSYELDEWGPEMTDEVPMRVIVQTHAQMAVGGLLRVWVPVLIGGSGLRVYRIERNEDMIKLVEQKCAEFWQSVQKRVPPPERKLSMEAAKLVKRQQGKTVQLSDDLVHAYSVAKSMLKHSQQRVDEIEERILSELGDAERGVCAAGEITYYQQTRRSLDGKALAQAEPKIWERFSRETKYRVLRLKGPSHE